MYERLIQKLLTRNIGAIAGHTPTAGYTYCTVESGDFSQTFDQSEYTGCCFKQNQSCLSEWYWDTPAYVTKFWIFSGNYYPHSRIVKIWGRVFGSWVEVWSGDWRPPTAKWDSKTISCTNCTGIRISQMHAVQTLRPCINEVIIDHGAEGKASIVRVVTVSKFTPGEAFGIATEIRNDGVSDDLFIKVTNTDTGKVIGEMVLSIPSGGIEDWVAPITLVQTTDFHGRVDVGHIQ